MDRMLGLLRVRVVRGINLAYRDTRGSDPYVVVRLGAQKLKTSVKKHNVNPVWNEDLTLSVSEPLQPVKKQVLQLNKQRQIDKELAARVYDKDTFSRDDKMGEAELDIQAFVEAVKMKYSGLANGTIITTVRPNRQNCLADDSSIVWKGGTIVQDVILRLTNVECGELELQLLWINMPGAPGF